MSEKEKEEKLWNKITKGKKLQTEEDKTQPYNVFSVKYRFAPYFDMFGGFMFMPTAGLWRTEIAYTVITDKVGGLGLPSLMSMAQDNIKVKKRVGAITVLECLGKQVYDLDDLMKIIDSIEFHASEEYIKQEKWKSLQDSPV